ncbi:MAG: hypothetical protein JWN45_1808 [Acidobacteriaceae bacterium]|nr:hypothetical protein [Acidobacteriaceae bacterium]
MYSKVYVKSQLGQAALHPIRVGGHISTWSGCDQADGSWIGVVYPSSAHAREELAALEGMTVFPSHLHDEERISPVHYDVLPDGVKSQIKKHPVTKEPAYPGGRQLAKLLHLETGHPALHPDT